MRYKTTKNRETIIYIFATGRSTAQFLIDASFLVSDPKSCSIQSLEIFVIRMFDSSVHRLRDKNAKQLVTRKIIITK